MALAVVVLLCWLAFFHGLGGLGLTDKTEALFVEVAREMLQRGDAITPWWNGERFFDYPVWGYWMVAGSLHLFGTTEWAARLPVALAASSVVVAAFGLLLVWPAAAEPSSHRLGRALLAAGVLATTPGWIGWGRFATTDMFLSSAITLALFSFLLAHRCSDRPLAAPLGRVGLALFSAIAVLAKGPVGVVLPALVIAVFLSLTGQWRRWWQPGPLLAMAALFAAVALPWYAAATRVNGEAFLWGFLGFSNVQRFTSVLYDHPGPPWFYLPWLLLLLLPWSLALPAAIAAVPAWRPGQWRRAAIAPELELPLFLLVWLLVIVALFSAAATKLPGYILPAVPAASLLVALWWRPLPPLPTPAGAPLLASGVAQALLLTLLTVAAALAPRWAATDPTHPGFQAALQASGLPLTLTLLLALSAAATLLLLRPSLRGWLWLPNLAGFLAILALVVAPLAPLVDRERQLPIRELARLARDAARPAEPLWVIGTKRYSVLFYGGETAVFLSGRRRIDSRLQSQPERLGLTAASASVRLLGDRRDLEALGFAAERVQRLARRGEQQLWRLRREDLRS
ncbi:MAG: ArnT family glycosyltransferase [Cyanobium sp.]